MVKATTLSEDRKILRFLKSLAPKDVARRLKLTKWRVYCARKRKKQGWRAA